MIYLVHLDFNSVPIGVWNEQRDSYYPEEVPLKKSATSLLESQMDGESWEDFTDRICDRISHRDWWETHESNNNDLGEVWHEIVPSSEPLDVR